MTEYDENFITTYTGKQFHYLDPDPDEIDIKDIAHALSLSCRFRGHCKFFYSVAEHSVRVSEIVPPEFQLEALLHDAAEAYIPDIQRPIKIFFGMQKADDAIQQTIYNKYGLWEGMSEYTHDADNILIATEARDLMANTKDWEHLPAPLNGQIFPWYQTYAEWKFLNLFETYICMGVTRGVVSKHY